MTENVKVCKLSREFYLKYSKILYPELLYKQDRPYTCLMINMNFYIICIPFRTNIYHKEAYFFKNTKRSRFNKSGLDFKKVVLIKDFKYVDSNSNPIVDEDEYTELFENLEKIIKGITNYIDKYKNHLTGRKNMTDKEYKRHYQFSTLEYFNDILLNKIKI